MKIKSIINITCLYILLIQNLPVTAKNIVENYEPKHWWTGMNYNNILIAVKGTSLNTSFIKIDYPGITFNKLIFTKKNNFVFLDIKISDNAIAGNVPIKIFQLGKLQQTIYFELKNRNYNYTPKVLNSSDVVYQIIIDRFKNGNYSNDKISGYLETTNKANPSGIHGGDIDGVIQEVNYIKSLSITTIELSPIYESNQLSNSYYHNEITNHYQVDKHLGSLTTINNFSQQCKSQNLKYIQSIVLHQASRNHWLFAEDLFDHWILKPMDLIKTDTSIPAECDPYSSSTDLTKQFYKENPDLKLINQDIKLAADYLIQNTIWWIENIKPDGIKIENTHFNRTSFISTLVKSLKTEYPKLNVITDIETNHNDELAFISDSYFQSQSEYNYDYPISVTLANAFSEYIPISESMKSLHERMAKDFNYSYPQKHLVFIDNNTSSRAYTLADKNINQLEMMYTFWATARGIPSLLYGSEILLEGNQRRGLGQSRTDFPGGWTNDKTNGFNETSLSIEQVKFKKFIVDILKWRSFNQVIQNGKTKHFLLKEDLYALLRYDSEKSILIVFNNNTNIEKINISDCSQKLAIYTKAINPLNRFEYSDLKNLIIESKSAIILELE